MVEKIKNKKLNLMLQTLQGNLAVSFFILLLTGFAFSTGVLITKVTYLQKGGSPTPSTGDGSAVGGAVVTPPVAAAKGELDKPTSTDHIRGSKSAKIALIDYTDFSCPYCKRFHVTLNDMLKQYDGKVQLIYRHFPLTSLHPNAQKQAEATECVFKLGGDAKFWTYVDQIYASDAEVTVDVMKTMAANLGLDKTKFATCLDNDETKSIIDADLVTAAKAGVQGTPGNFLMNLDTGEFTQLQGAVPIEQLKVSIDAMLK